MPQRIPVDIQFLFESLFSEKILKEDPDYADVRNSESEDLDAAEAGGVSKQAIGRLTHGLDWSEKEAIPFVYVHDLKILVYGMEVHSDIFEYVDDHRAKNEKLKFVPSSHGQMLLRSVNSKGVALPPIYERWQLGFFGLNAENSKEKLIEWIKACKAYDTDRNKWIKSGMVLGRFWHESHVVSFWNKEDVVRKHLRDFYVSLGHAMETDISKVGFEIFGKVFSLKQLISNDTQQSPSDKMSDDEYKELLAKQHLDPVAKKKAIGTDDYRAMHMKKHAQGFDFAAMANAMKQTSDGVIRTGKLLKESPDEVYLKADSETPDLTHLSTGAVPFIYYPRTDLLFYISDTSGKNDVTHWDMLRAILRGRQRLENNAEEPQEAFKFMRSEDAAPVIDLRNHTLSHPDNDVAMNFKGSDKALFHYLWHTAAYIEKEPSADEYRSNGVLGIFGRQWPKHNVVAVWNDTASTVELKENGELAKLLHALKAIPAHTLISAGDALETVAFDELGGENKTAKTMSADEYRELLAKQHLDPKVKAMLAGDDYKMAHMRKHAQGFDFAAKANAMKQTSDAIIPTKKLIGDR